LKSDAFLSSAKPADWLVDASWQALVEGFWQTSDGHQLSLFLNERQKADTGDFTYGTTITTAYLPNDNSEYFEYDQSLIDWLRQYAQTDEEKEEVSIRGFLGRMLFSGEEALKSAKVLSGGEKVRCMLSKMMLAKANLLMMDEPTNHLDLESITALNNGMRDFPGNIIFTSHDHELVNTVANRIIEITPTGFIDKIIPVIRPIIYK
jgi:ATPase subunit of ABC transporter with duplicated ATPase domains